MADPFDFKPNFNTPESDQSKEEINKRNSGGVRGTLQADFAGPKQDLPWESEQLAKSYGVYLEYNRAQTGTEKDWIYLIRLSVPGGGPLNRDQWLLLDELSEKYTKGPDGFSSLRLTTRQNIQFHWVKKENVPEIVRATAKSGLFSLNGCGDNVRNTMSCPLSHGSKLLDGSRWAQIAADYFRLPVQPFIEIFSIDPKYARQEGETFRYGPQLLNRKFKIAFSSIYENPETGKLTQDNCVELRTNDLGVSPILRDGKVQSFQVYVGGGQGERNGKPTMSALAQPFAVVPEKSLLAVLDAIVQVHQQWGDRQNRHWARVKYVVRKMGIPWYRQQVEERTGLKLDPPDPGHDYGARMLHHGWHVHPSNRLLAYGAFIENGRLSDGAKNGRLKSMVSHLMKTFPIQVAITPNQDLLFSEIPINAKNDFEKQMSGFEYGARNGTPYSDLRKLSGACVGRDTCRLTYTDSERFEPELMDQLEDMGWGGMKESIGITGCERQCFRPGTKTIGLVGSGLNRYLFKLMGTEDGRHQGVPLTSEDGTLTYLHSVPRDKVAVVIDALFRYYQENKAEGESMGYFHRRVETYSILQFLREDPATAELIKSPKKGTAPFDNPEGAGN